MTAEQKKALGDVHITRIEGNPANVHVPFKGRTATGEEQDFPPLKEVAKDYDIVAVVLPIHLLQQLLGVVPDGVPVIQAKNRRVFVPCPNGGESKAEFHFDGWKKVEKVEIVMSDFVA